MRYIVPLSRSLVVGACLLAAQLLIAREATFVLNVDGIVHVKAFPIAGTRMTIVEHDAPPEVVTEGLQRFDRALALQSAFLVAFEREGCVTKQLYFDTHVPEDALENAPFDFPFLVTLEPPPNGHWFQYAGPVGYIRYYPDRGDFGYDTDYSLSADPILAERMRLLITGAEPAPLPTPIPVSAAIPVVPVTPDTNAFNILVPTASKRPVLIHPTGSSSDDPSPVRPAIAEPIPVAVKVHTPIEPVVASADEPVDTSTEVRPLAQDHTSDRSEELIVDQRWVIRIVRLTRDGHTTEYRRVLHHTGQVFYFKDGLSCSEWTYEHEVL